MSGFYSGLTVSGSCMVRYCTIPYGTVLVLLSHMLTGPILASIGKIKGFCVATRIVRAFHGIANESQTVGFRVMDRPLSGSGYNNITRVLVLQPSPWRLLLQHVSRSFEGTLLVKHWKLR